MPITKGQGNPDWTVDKIILALELILRCAPRVPGKDSTEIKKLSDGVCSLPIHPATVRNERFRNPAGVYMKVQNLLSIDAPHAGRKWLGTSRTDRAVWAAYSKRSDEVRKLAAAILDGAGLITSVTSLDESEDDFGVPEGEILPHLHRRHERRSLRAKLVQKRRAANSLRCDACSCGPRLKDVGPGPEASEFEAHHVPPLRASGARTTRFSDLALLCANCHRLIHAVMRATATHQTVEDLKRSLGPRV